MCNCNLPGAGRHQEQSSVVQTRWSGFHSPPIYPVVESRSSTRSVEGPTTVVRDRPSYHLDLMKRSWNSEANLSLCYWCSPFPNRFSLIFSDYGEDIPFHLFFAWILGEVVQTSSQWSIQPIQGNSLQYHKKRNKESYYWESLPCRPPTM